MLGLGKKERKGTTDEGSHEGSQEGSRGNFRASMGADKGKRFDEMKRK
jgi:hypothetical protein